TNRPHEGGPPPIPPLVARTKGTPNTSHLPPPTLAMEPLWSYKELSGVTHVSETVLRREVDLHLVGDDCLNMDTNPTQLQQCLYAVYILIDMRYEMAGRERELLLAYAEHGHYPGGKANCTQAEKLGDIINGRGIKGQLWERKWESKEEGKKKELPETLAIWPVR
ncbi:uncharacterized protein BDR25DRAFT_356466, partial [Lindgomyces ingoldianus]